MTLKAAFSLAAIVVTVINYAPYIRAIRRGERQPHVFSWLVWSLTLSVIFFAQLAGRGGAGAWPTGVTGLLTIYIACLAWSQRAGTQITRLDWLFFLTALSSLPVWLVTSDPLWTVVALTVVDLAGFGPTIARAYRNPHGESILFFALFIFRNILSLLALENYSLTTVLFPAADAAACLVLTITLLYRQKSSWPRA